MSDPQTLSILKRAKALGLELRPELKFNEQGLDFQVVFAKDLDGQPWVLRIPRRPEVWAKVLYESKVLDFVKTRLTARVPDWRIVDESLIAYPMLEDSTALSFDPETYAVTWHIDQHSPRFLQTLALALVELHSAPRAEVLQQGIREDTPAEIRRKAQADFERVRSEIGMSVDLEAFGRDWLANDSLWPSFTGLIHGDLYAGHMTANTQSELTGIIDWTEAQLGDVSTDFAGHLAGFGDESLSELLKLYQTAGGRCWPGMLEQIKARHRTSPIKYGIFALETGSEEHLAAAQAQLGVG